MPVRAAAIVAMPNRLRTVAWAAAARSGGRVRLIAVTVLASEAARLKKLHATDAPED